MPSIQFECVIDAPLRAVWAFHEDVMGSLPALSPPEDAVQLEHADLPVRVGSRIVILARGPMGKKIRWVARIVEHKPPHRVNDGEAACFTDEQESGPFKCWRHEHRFTADEQGRTVLTDGITYEIGLGVLGWIADRLLVRRKIAAMFAHRHSATRRLVERKR